MSGSHVDAPKPSAAETALQQEQTNALRQQQEATAAQLKQQNLLMPALLKSSGLTATYDSSGNITGYTEAPKTPQQQLMEKLQTSTLQQAYDEQTNPQNQQIKAMLRQRTLSALKGDLPVDPGLENDIKKNRSMLEETLRKQIGPGYTTSTAGEQALADFDANSSSLRYGARTGQLTLAEQLGGATAQAQGITNQTALANVDLSANLRNQNFGQIMGAGQFSTPTIGMMGQNAAGFSNPLSWYTGNRNSQYQAGVANAQSRDSSNQGWGALAGTAITAAAYFF